MTPSHLLHKYAHRALTLIFLLTVTLTMSAQWTTQGEEGGIPAYNAGPPPKGAKLPTILAKSDTNSRAIAIATAWATTACIVASKTRTARAAPPA